MPLKHQQQQPEPAYRPCSPTFVDISPAKTDDLTC
jgi:hypothetical protein